MNLVCPACQATNRVPEERLSDGPVCGRCGADLTPDHPVALTDDSFQAYVGKTEQPVLVDFWADWCGPCKMMAPHFAQVATQEPGMRFAKVDTEAAPRTAGAFGIRSIPTLILFKNGREVARQSGAMGASDLRRWLQSATAG